MKRKLLYIFLILGLVFSEDSSNKLPKFKFKTLDKKKVGFTTKTLQNIFNFFVGQIVRPESCTSQLWDLNVDWKWIVKKFFG